MKKVSTFELLKTLFRNEVLSQQAHSAKFQAEIAVNKRALKKLVIKIGNAILVAYFMPYQSAIGRGNFFKCHISFT